MKTDAIDACTLAELLAAGLIPRVWIGDETTRLMRRLVSRRRQLVKESTRAKNEISAVLLRTLQGRPSVSDVFGKAGRAWLAALELGIDECETVEAGLRQLDFLQSELGRVDRAIAERALGSAEIRRLMTIPGVDVTTAATLMATIGDVARFPSPRQLVGYLGLDPSSASRASRSRATAASRRRARQRPGTRSSRPPGRPRRRPVRCALSPSGQRRDADATSPPSRSPASSPYSPGTSSRAARTTPTNAPPSFAASCAGSSSRRARRARSARPARHRSEEAATKTTSSASSHDRPSSPTGGSSPTGSGHNRKTVRARHRGAHLLGHQSGKQRGRTQPHLLRFNWSSPAPSPVFQGSRRSSNGTRLSSVRTPPCPFRFPDGAS